MVTPQRKKQHFIPYSGFFFFFKKKYFPQNACIFIVFLIVTNVHGKSSTKCKSAIINSLPHHKVKVKLLSRVRLFETPWTVAYQAPLSMEFSKQEYWSGLPFPSPGNLLTQGSNPGLPHSWQMLYHLSHQGSPTIKSLIHDLPQFFLGIYVILHMK